MRAHTVSAQYWNNLHKPSRSRYNDFGFVTLKITKETKEAGVYIEDSLICDAYIWALDKYRNKYGTRGFRLLTDADFGIIYELRAQLGREWAVEKDIRGKTKYYPWRHERLNELMVEKKWSQETRDLYASMLSSILTWSRNGQNNETKERLKLLYVGSSLCLQFLNRFPVKLTTNGAHNAKPL